MKRKQNKRSESGTTETKAEQVTRKQHMPAHTAAQQANTSETSEKQNKRNESRTSGTKADTVPAHIATQEANMKDCFVGCVVCKICRVTSNLL
jgi:hypothetical protein